MKARELQAGMWIMGWVAVVEILVTGCASITMDKDGVRARTVGAATLTKDGNHATLSVNAADKNATARTKILAPLLVGGAVALATSGSSAAVQAGSALGGAVVTKLGQDAVDSVQPAAGGQAPVIIQVPGSAPATPPAGNVAPCGCNLSGPLVMPPFNGAELAEAGNSQECPVYDGRDIRFRVNPSGWLIASVFYGRLEYNGNKFRVHCPTVDGYQYHVIGYSHDPIGSKAVQFQVPADGWMDYECTTVVHAECRRTAK